MLKLSTAVRLRNTAALVVNQPLEPATQLSLPLLPLKSLPQYLPMDYVTVPRDIPALVLCSAHVVLSTVIVGRAMPTAGRDANLDTAHAQLLRHLRHLRHLRRRSRHQNLELNHLHHRSSLLLRPVQHPRRRPLVLLTVQV
jgi:hypothetical protein